ncbi:hypothetical protein CC1G_09978 [Coprinopsis cinerea okayama7|uniref:Ricin B lectin domain-containing protein n=1 Tax=Coprinopsis cinerea (strain Okayama-7 / 130 / ATCC MYA-4618 / FGSC 9003) TaxID=240176 RepID=A8NDG2_COPC7|nr:hypothetical protein CC1G_09978 [Coprinopsis cinerea okayama7\|eukprot:XP_001832764.2 hypothetical protein CC1G_09978 [Coprinopsis cinerea okayama7\
MAEDEHGNFPGKMQVQLADRDSHIWQKLRLDTNVAPCPPCIPREMYKIINIQTSTLAHLENNGNVSGFCYNEGRNQLWEPIPYEGSMRSYLYYFKNVFNGKYLGIRKHEEAKHETRVIGCDEPFLWNVVPDVGVTDGYRLFVPFTEKNMDLCGDSPAPGTVIHLDPRRIPGKCWKFERVYQVEDPRDVFGNELQLGPP